MLKLLLVGVGGCLGSICRYVVGEAAKRAADGRFPLGTLTVNLIGCLAIGLLSGWLATRPGEHEQLRLLAVVGFLGGFTTFSAFGQDTVNLMLNDQLQSALLNVGIQVVVGVVAAWGGFALGKSL